MRTREVLEFASNQLSNLNSYTASNERFRDLDSKALQRIKTLIQKIKTELQAEDRDKYAQKEERQKFYEIKYTNFYRDILTELKRINTTLVRNIVYPQKGGDIRSKEESPLVDNIKAIRKLIKDKVKIIESDQYLQVVDKLSAKLQVEEEELIAEREKLRRNEEELIAEREKLQRKEQEYDQRLSMISAKADKNLARADKNLALLQRILSNLPPEMRKKICQQEAKELKILTSNDGGIDIEVTYEEDMPSSSQPSYYIKPKYLPNNQLQLSEKLLSTEPFEGAKLAFSLGMSPLHAQVAILLYRYFLKLTDQLAAEKPSARQNEYRQERQLDKKDNLKLASRISACIFYLFMETDKSKEEMLQDRYNPALSLIHLAETKNLNRLKSKFKKISGLSTELSNELNVLDKSKEKFEYIGKFATMFFKANKNLNREHTAYSYRLYKKETTGSDIEELHNLYRS